MRYELKALCYKRGVGYEPCKKDPSGIRLVIPVDPKLGPVCLKYWSQIGLADKKNMRGPNLESRVVFTGTEFQLEVYKYWLYSRKIRTGADILRQVNSLEIADKLIKLFRKQMLAYEISFEYMPIDKLDLCIAQASFFGVNPTSVFRGQPLDKDRIRAALDKMQTIMSYTR